MSKRWLSVVGLAAIGGFLWGSGAYAAPAKPGEQSPPLPPGETVAPAGAYQAAWLALENGLPGDKGGGSTALPMFLGLRDGKCVQAWSVTDKIRFNWFDRIELKLAGAALKGELEGRACGKPAAISGTFKYVLDSQVSGSNVTGSFTGTFGAAALSGKLSGTLRGEAEMAKDNAIALDWTSYLGNEGTAVAPPSKWKLVDSLDRARPVWKSEYYTPAGWGAGPDGRYPDASFAEGVNGGASTPVVWDKKVYLYHYYPNPELAKAISLDANPLAKGTKHPVELDNLRKFYAALSDDFVLCLDSATGKTLWRAMFPKRLRNLQTHKYRAANPTPWIEGGRLYVQNYAAGVYCLDAQTGKLIWEHPGNQGEFSTSSDSPSLTVAEGVVVVGLRGVLKGLDAATGRLLWQSKWGFNSPVRWTHGQRCLVISSRSCLDPKTGNVLWTAPVETVSYPRVSGDLLLGASTAEDVNKRKEPKLLCLEMKLEGAKLKWSAPVTPVGTGEVTMAIANGHVYFGGQELICVKLDTGEVTARQPKAPCKLNPTMCYADGRLILFPENHHGKMHLHMVDADPRTLNVLTEDWRAPHPTTTAYANMGIGILLLDGRLISRGQDGIYCYDLRKGAEK
jgi:outer membrane protein assembly factor BamB